VSGPLAADSQHSLIFHSGNRAPVVTGPAVARG